MKDSFPLYLSLLLPSARWSFVFASGNKTLPPAASPLKALDRKLSTKHFVFLNCIAEVSDLLEWAKCVALYNTVTSLDRKQIVLQVPSTNLSWKWKSELPKMLNHFMKILLPVQLVVWAICCVTSSTVSACWWRTWNTFCRKEKRICHKHFFKITLKKNNNTRTQGCFGSYIFDFTVLNMITF